MKLTDTKTAAIYLMKRLTIKLCLPNGEYDAESLWILGQLAEFFDLETEDFDPKTEFEKLGMKSESDRIFATPPPLSMRESITRLFKTLDRHCTRQEDCKSP